ncbi:DUF1653 domain-containing protein [Massilia sp. MS-15]|uniref:DUF1653 domain-containing protein n=1 Tax=Massilia sp. MS-15 TaxID=2878200 RepID=UPI001CD37ADC|nr:DUF1653 domain-containing protein [Massilia sp. MS-15]MCA1247091.1 DUF1653 domain-containing protein [Massilia sp. MS-15]
MSAARHYRHYKGGLYELLVEAVLEADHTPVMVYRGQDGKVWVRPRAAFFETVHADGVAQPRFRALDDPGSD